MKSSNTPILKDLVLIGGGHSHVSVLKRFGMHPLPGVRITLITRDVHTPYSGMLPGLIAGHYSFDEAHIDLRPLAIFAGARLFHSRAKGLDLVKKRVLLGDRPAIGYDLLSINIGSQPQSQHVLGASEFSLPVKPIDRFLQGWAEIRARVLATKGVFKLCVVGGGAGGVELALATQYRLLQELRTQHRTTEGLEVRLISAQTELMVSHNPSVRRRFTQLLAQRGIKVVYGQEVSSVHPNRVVTTKASYPTDAVLWVTQASAQSWLANTGLSQDADGFIQVDDCLQSVSHPEVFACGDIAAVVNHPREKSGVFAVRQGPPLARNLRRRLVGKHARRFIPQKDFLGLISTGNQYAIASRGRWSMAGTWLWKIKDWIDRRFMRNFSELPKMAEAPLPKVGKGLADAAVIRELSTLAMRCGGCGAKVGGTVLSRVMNQLQPLQREDILVGLHAPDDAAVLEVPAGQVMVQSVDYFRAFIDDAYLFGRIAANHSLGDIFAMGAQPQSALAIATLPYGREAVVEDQLHQLMSGAIEVLNGAGAALVGGHSSEGQELAFGLNVNGLIAKDQLLRKGGMQPGECIVLTKPLGTGTLLAADMRSKAKGRWVHAAIDSMLLSNAAAARVLMSYDCSACTDVTGFGLLGHLVEMTRASNVDIHLCLSAVTALDGALETIAAGIFSSLQPQNIRLRRALRGINGTTDHHRLSLAFDPQTAGGLLASIPAQQAEPCLNALQAQGYKHSVIIGTVVARGEAMEPIVLV